MKPKRILLLVTIFCVFFPSSAFGEERQVSETSVGIGFVEESPGPIPEEPTPNDPAPIDNVLPTTLNQTGYRAQDNQPKDVIRGTLPKTGEQRQKVLLQIIGLGCVVSCFWLFLFTRLREEEDYA